MTALQTRYPRFSLRPFILLACLTVCGADSVPLNAQILTKEDLQKETAVYEAASRHARQGNMPSVQEGRIWSHLGTLYQDAGRYGSSQTAYEHALRLLTVAPVSRPDLAFAIDSLGTLYMETGNLKEAEQAERKALKIRERAGLKSELPRSWYHLATLYLREHRPAESGEFARRAVDAFSRDANVSPEEKLGSRLVLASSACQAHRYQEAIAQLQSALPLTIKTYGPDKYPTGLNLFLLGYAYWKKGDLASAHQSMERGYEIVGKEMAWHPTYLFFMTHYAHLLRDEHKWEDARAMEDRIKKMRAELSADPAHSLRLQVTDVAALF